LELFSSNMGIFFMRIWIHNTRDIALCKDLKADELRIWAGILSMVKDDLIVPPKAMIAKRCLVRTARVTMTLEVLTRNGFLMDTELTVNPKYISHKSRGIGSVPFSQDFLKEFSRNRVFFAVGLRLFYYLLGDIRNGNQIFDTNLTDIAAILDSDRPNLSRLLSQFKEEGFLEEFTAKKAREPFGKKYYVISDSVLGATKRR